MYLYTKELRKTMFKKKIVQTYMALKSNDTYIRLSIVLMVFASSSKNKYVICFDVHCNTDYNDKHEYNCIQRML